MEVEGVAIPVLDIDGLLKAKTDYWEKDVLDKSMLRRLKSGQQCRRAERRQAIPPLPVAFGRKGAATGLTMAWFRRKPTAALLHHSDRGSQYASQAFQGKLKEFGMACSMSRKGNCWDNAPTESWFNRFKNERVHGERFATRAKMTAMAFEYIEVFYNRKRLHSTLGYKPPTRFLQDWLAAAQQREKQVA